MKKGPVSSLLSVFLSLQLVLAQNQIIEEVIDTTSQALGSIFSPIFNTGYGEFLFAKILLFFFLFAMVFVALKQIELFEDNTPVLVVLTTVTSILSVRYLKPGEFINALLLPYSALVASLTLLLPMVIFFYFIQKSGMGRIGRRAAWFIYGLFFVMLWGTREAASLGTANWIYVIALIFILVNLFFDKTIRTYFDEMGYDKAESYLYDREILQLKEDHTKAVKAGDYKLAKKINKKIKKLRKMQKK